MKILFKNKSISWFEFLPSWVMYLPVAVYCLYLSIRYKHWALPLIANPGIALSGMVGEEKSAVFKQLGTKGKAKVEPYIVCIKQIDLKLDHYLAQLEGANLSFPVVAKPDIGCRGAGVKLIDSPEQLHAYINNYPNHQQFLLQKKADWPYEAGIFYVRFPNQELGFILSITLKILPTIIGDGINSIQQLIEQDPRAQHLTHLYFPALSQRLPEILPKGEIPELVFTGNHCRGAIFKDGNQFITDQLNSAMNEILLDMDGFYYGRLDIKFKDLDSLQKGENFSILEINGASSEAAHIWDSNGTFFSAIKMLCQQYKILYQIGDLHRRNGYPLPSLKHLLIAWKKERALVQDYQQLY
ncbi:D-alanine--D-alanine ligase [Photobacterium damselae subsp. damselae]